MNRRFFFDGQGIHVGAYADMPRAIAAPELPHHTGAADAQLHRVAHAGKAFRHDVAGSMLGKTQFGMLMQISSKIDEVLHIGAQGL